MILNFQEKSIILKSLYLPFQKFACTKIMKQPTNLIAPTHVQNETPIKYLVHSQLHYDFKNSTKKVTGTVRLK